MIFSPIFVLIICLLSSEQVGQKISNYKMKTNKKYDFLKACKIIIIKKEANLRLFFSFIGQSQYYILKKFKCCEVGPFSNMSFYKRPNVGFGDF